MMVYDENKLEVEEINEEDQLEVIYSVQYFLLVSFCSTNTVITYIGRNDNSNHNGTCVARR